MQVEDKGRIVVGIGRADDFIEDGTPYEHTGVQKYETGKKAKAASRAGYELLKMLLWEEFGIDISQENEPIVREDGGKPFLKNRGDVFFNISHSGEYVACAVGSVPMGIDIQYHKKTDTTKIAKKILSKKEWRVFETAGRSVGAFYSFWTKKESFLKYTGEGIRRNLKELDYEGCRFFALDFQEGYSGKICLPEYWNGEIMIKKWQ